MTSAKSRRVFHLNRKRSQGPELLLVVVLLGLLLATMLTIAQISDEAAKILLEPQILWPFLVVPPMILLQVWVTRRFAQTARLVVDGEGFSVRSELPGFFRIGIMANRDCRWEDINRVMVVDRMGLVNFKPRKLGSQPIPLRITDWVEKGSGTQQAGRRVPISEMRSTALWQALDAAGVFSELKSDRHQGMVNFDLMQHPASRATLLVLGLLVGYAFIDGIFNHEAWAEWNFFYLWPHIVLAVLGGGIGFAVLVAARRPRPIPLGIAAMLAMLLSVATGAASWNGLVRVNQLLGEPLVEQPYVRSAACTELVPKETGLPMIEYTEQAKDYWCQFPENQIHQVPVRRGLGGYYQVDLSRHTQALREFRQARR